MMGKMGEAQVVQMNQQSKLLLDDVDEDINSLQVSKFIISPGNYWNIQWNNLT